MAPKSHAGPQPTRWYRGADIPMRVIRRFARQVAERFDPDKIILFGSYAYGTPHADSDVDVLVVMPARNELDQAVRIRLAVPYNFPLDPLVRTPKNLTWRLAEGDPFLKEITARGKVLYEKTTREWVQKTEVDYRGARKLGPSRPPMHDLVCFCCQQCIEKYLKTLLVWQAIPFSKTHDLRVLMRLIPLKLRPHLASRDRTRITKYAAVIRYPLAGKDVTLAQARKEVAIARRVRRDVRRLLPRAALRRRKK